MADDESITKRRPPGRPRLYEDVLSDAERARRYRQKKKAKTQSADAIPPLSDAEHRAIKRHAKDHGLSETALVAAIVRQALQSPSLLRQALSNQQGLNL
ncbi:hypothetical protein [Allochromatium vinosum]|uniref:Uncharacterized protein n=1 Tax=Allochromatium vinosum (strain ATCC 17899 / DSM 180 / NBRC 103801 / NCIMB 10441 / D) TaxID=572477 RepID=D3RTX1_ALLVD|nr:hypothetical protein [Allochromatium vinosum]ADC62630.1 hypothetical protein Alvin_1698 [Allochromatium vinosum DSM 180]